MSGLRKAGKRRLKAEKERHRASEHLAAEIRKARRNGMGPTAIAEEAGVSRQTVQNVLKEVEI